MHLTYRNCNAAFDGLVTYFGMNASTDRIKRKPSRVGEVLMIPEPVTVTYCQPLERVLFNETRDCNPFFHLMESLWMLAGRNDVAPMSYYNSQIAGVASDDGKTFHGGYGKRWRGWFGYDQLAVLVEELRKNPGSRRCVLQMWDACCCEEAKDQPGRRHDLWAATHGGKDVPCNTQAYFSIDDGLLDMTVCNRSNDLVWGMLGANVVHFSFLQEYLAVCIGVKLGKYHQFTNNLHVYTERFKGAEWSNDATPDYYTGMPRMNYVPLVAKPERFDEELPDFVNNFIGEGALMTHAFEEPFLRGVAYPAHCSYRSHKARDYASALRWASEILADDWRAACTVWISRRKASYDQRQTLDNPYLKNELERLAE